ncbi:hypothetical protein O4J56_13280 [Nocardiopsis sp. RSe5-2]|uniref:Uncharacterized protein n=1 Tax=Nocardiopsis endophytica TaxID=3018445 RepID=A0ABT4U3R7_9ACTN|nr:hypothetical protein [Nocardiopsis endophytica]MDA2811608.1 hypothetical protein [Nocardiopsis endophytica]
MGEFVAILAIALPVLAVVGGLVAERRLSGRTHRLAIDRSAVRVDEHSTQIHSLAESLRRSVELVRSGSVEEEAREALADAKERLRRSDELLGERDRLADARAQSSWRAHSEELERAARRWDELEHDAAGLLGELREAEERCSRVLAASASIGDGEREAERLAGQGRSAAQEARAQGYSVDGESSVLATAHRRLEEVRGLALEGRPMAAREALTALTSELADTVSALQGIAERESLSRRRLDALAGAGQENGDRRTAAVAALEELTAGYTAALSEGLRARLEEGDRSAAEAAEHVRAAREGLEGRDVHRAETALDAAEEAHERAGEEFGAAVARLETVQELSASVPGRRLQTMVRLTELAERAASDEGSGHLSPVLQSLRARVEALDVEADRPDWLRLRDGLDEAEQLAAALSEATEAAVSGARRARSEIDRLESALRWSEQERISAQDYVRKELGRVPPAAHTGTTRTDDALGRALGRLRHMEAAAERYSVAVNTSLFNPRAAASAARDYAAAMWAAGRLDEAAQIAEEARNRYAGTAGQEAVADLRVVISLIDAERAAVRG